MIQKRLVLFAALAAILSPLFAFSAAGARERQAAQLAKAIFAGGCFWCMEPPFDELEGVVSTTSGYTAGRTENPTYEQVSNGGTGHTEALEVVYDPAKVSYDKLLEVFWRNVDDVDGDGQFCDRGSQYRPGIFYHSEDQKQKAEQSKERISARLRQPVAVQIQPAAPPALKRSGASLQGRNPG